MPEDRSGNGHRFGGNPAALAGRAAAVSFAPAAGTRRDTASNPAPPGGPAPPPGKPRGTIESRSRADAEAILSALARLFRDTVYRYCRRMLGSDADASDVSQIVFMQAFEALCDGVDVQSERAWLLGITRNRCLDRFRRLSLVLIEQEELEQAVDGNQEGGPVMPDPAASRALEDCLDTLDPRSRAVLLLRFHDDLSYQEISALTGDTPGALRVRVARALPLLRNCLKLKGVAL